MEIVCDDHSFIRRKMEIKKKFQNFYVSGVGQTRERGL